MSDSQRYRIVQNRVENAKGANARVLDELSTQKSIRDVSDNPIGVTQSIRFKDRIGSANQHLRNIEFAQGFLTKTESAISDLNDNLMRAKELGIYMSNDTNDGAARLSSGREIEEIIKEIIQLGNSQYNGRFVFAGFRTDAPPLSPDGDFLGDDGAIFVEVSEGGMKQFNIQARNLFETTPEERDQGHFNMVDALGLLYDGLSHNDKYKIQKSLDELDFQLAKTTSYQASLGGLSNALAQTQGRVEKEKDDLKAALSNVEDSDVFRASSEFRRTEGVLQSTLLASNKMLQPSLLNFMQ